MDLERVHAILNKDEKYDVYYRESPVWIQEVNNDIARVGFIENTMEKDVYIQDLYERNLYN